MGALVRNPSTFFEAFHNLSQQIEQDVNNILALLQKVCLVYSHSSICLQKFALALQDTFRCHRKGLITRRSSFQIQGFFS